MLIDNCRHEILLLSRYAGIGVLNTAVSFACIFSSMAIGFSTISSNAIGYGVGFLLGLVFSKKFVFFSNGNFLVEGIRYLFCFVFCFLCNLLILQLALHVGVHPVISQFIAAISFSIFMYLSSRLFIFNTTSN